MKIHQYTLLATLVFISQLHRTQQTSLRNEEQMLRECIFKNYSKDVRPVTNNSKPILVTLDVEFMHVVSVDERKQLIKLKLWLRMKWINELLKWDPQKWGGTNEIKVDPNLLWKPDIIDYNEGDTDLQNSMEHYRALIHVQADGLNYWIIRIMSTTSCPLNVEYFPFDQQTCTLKFGSWAYSNAEIRLITDNRPFITKYYIHSSEWHLYNITQEKQIEMFMSPYSTLLIKFTIDRKSLYYLFNVLVPCIILMLIILISFYLPPDSGERVGVTITVLLAFTVFLQLVQGSLPATSTSIPLLSVFYVTIMAESGCSLLTTCIVLIIHYRGSTKGVSRLPDWVRKYVLNFLGIKLGVTHVEIKNCSFRQTCPVKDNIGMENQIWSTNMFNLPSPQMDIDNLEISNQTYAEQSATDELVNEVKVITSLINNQDKEDEIEAEWKTLGLILDRIFFGVFLITFILTTLVVLVPASVSTPKH